MYLSHNISQIDNHTDVSSRTRGVNIGLSQVRDK